jgi:ATP-binding cassette subfamily C (CFTR/MRP) protein 1
MQRYYIPTARELARLSEIQRAPILHHFAESLTGAASIRAYGQKDRFSKANLSLCNNHSRPWFHSTAAIEWLCFRLNMLSNFVFAFSLTLLVSLPEGFINPSKFCMYPSYRRFFWQFYILITKFWWLPN